MTSRLDDKIYARLNSEDKSKFFLIARRNGVQPSQVVRAAIKSYIKEYQPQSAANRS